MSDSFFLYFVKLTGLFLAFLSLGIIYQGTNWFDAVVGMFGFVCGITQALEE